MPVRLGLINQPANEIILILIASTGLFSLAIYLSKNNYKAEMLDILILIFLIVYPIFSAIVAWFTTRQPIYMGFLTFRGMYVLLAYYIFILAAFSKRTIVVNVAITVSFIIIIMGILFFVYGFNDFNTIFRKGSLITKYGYTTTKGLQFSGYTCLFYIPYVYGWVKYFEKNKTSFLLLPVILLLFSVFVSKARNEIFTLTILPLLMYYLKYKFYDIKFLFVNLLIISLLFVILMTDNAVSRSFSGLLRPTDLNFSQKTGDYSAYLRVEESKAAWKWFIRYPVTGVGSLSYRYHNGYMGLISDFFYISDIGLLGVMVKGGLILVFLYVIFYRKMISYFSGDDIYSVTGRFMVLFLIIELLIGNDFLVNFTGTIVVLFLLKPSKVQEMNRITSEYIPG